MSTHKQWMTVISLVLFVTACDTKHHSRPSHSAEVTASPSEEAENTQDGIVPQKNKRLTATPPGEEWKVYKKTFSVGVSEHLHGIVFTKFATSTIHVEADHWEYIEVSPETATKGTAQKLWHTFTPGSVYPISTPHGNSLWMHITGPMRSRGAPPKILVFGFLKLDGQPGLIYISGICHPDDLAETEEAVKHVASTLAVE